MIGQEASPKECIYYVQGMHCPTCELLIEKGLLKNKGVESVEASASQGRVTIFFKGKKPTIKRLNKQFKKEGYHFSEEMTGAKEKKPLFRFNQGRFLIDKNRFSQHLQVLSIALLLIINFILLGRSGLASKIVVASSSALPAFFLFGLIAGFSSCAALVGGLVLSMSKQWSEIYRTKSSTWQKSQPHLLFNLGRLASFALLGAVLGGLGAFLQLSSTATSLLAIGVSIIMVLLALQMLGVKRFQKLQITMPKFISRFVADETHFKGRYMPFLLGALTFFLPCGFTITSQGLALISGSTSRGSLIMFSFALGTLPMLLTIGFSALKLATRPHLSGQFLKIAGVLVLFFGLSNLNNQLNVLGWLSLDDLKPRLSNTAQIADSGLAPVIDGKQILKMDALAYGYEPNEFKVRAGIPVKWEIKNKGVSGCTNAIVSQSLFPGEIRIDKDLVVKEFTPEKPGKYKFSCWMGMVSGIISVVDQNSSTNESGEEIPSGVSGGGNRGSCGCGCGS